MEKEFNNMLLDNYFRKTETGFLNEELTRQMEKTDKEIIKMIGYMTSYYRFSYLLTIDRFKEFAMIVDRLQFRNNNQWFHKIVRATERLALELVCNGSADHRWFRGHYLYKKYNIWNDFYKEDEKLCRDVVEKWNVNVVIDWLLENKTNFEEEYGKMMKMI